MKWQDKLTAKERKHLRIVAGVRTLAGVKTTLMKQKEMREEDGSFEPCWDCRTIARKLDLPI